MAFSDIRKAFIDWVRSATAYDADHVLWADQNFPRESKPYIMLRLTSGNSLNHDYRFPPDPITGAAIVTGDREMTLAIQCYGDSSNDPIDILFNLYASLNIGSKYAILVAAGIVFVDDLLGPTDLSTVLDKTYERRGGMDLLMRFPWSVTDTDVGVVESTKIEGAFMNPDNSTIIVQEIDVSTVP